MSNTDKLNFIDDALQKRREEHRFRSLIPGQYVFSKARITREQKELINFCSNDYLGLATHPDVIERSVSFTQKYGAGSAASRLITGTLEAHQQLEEKLAKAFGTEAALIINAGFQANTSILPTVADRNSLILADKKVHNSLIQGALLSKATFKRYNHNDYDELERLLKEAQKSSYNRIWVVSETVFSMDGDRANTAKLEALAEEHDALLYLDDAHAVGVWGKDGLGLNTGRNGIHLSLGTFGKSFGAFGAYVACSQKMRDYLVNFCPGFIYTTALPPGVIGAIDAALELVPSMIDERETLVSNIEYVCTELQKMGFNTGTSDTQIIPLIIGSESETLELASYLEEHSILALAIRPPTVEQNASRIRLTITAMHTREEVDHLLKVLSKWRSNG